MSTRFDEENVLRMLQEDDAIQRRAFGMIVDEYGQQLYWQIRRLVLNHDDANDVLQETLIQAWKNIDYFVANQNYRHGYIALPSIRALIS